MKELINKVEQWFIDRNLHTLNGAGQLTKLNEEVKTQRTNTRSNL